MDMCKPTPQELNELPHVFFTADMPWDPSSTDDDTLDEPVQFFTDHDTKADIWALYVDHTIHHCGEISALKGVFGGKGLPF